MLGTLIGERYKVIKLLGSGGFGRTYLSQDTKSPDPHYCVIKHFQPVSQDENTLTIARRLFATEARILGLLGTHEQIPGLLDYFEENQEFYIVEDFAEGHPLSDELTRDNIMVEGKVIELLRDVLQILEFVHNKRVIHRDIKPGNLIRRPDGKIVLIDFGAVKELETQLVGGGTGLTQFTVGICTQGYTPGEQLAGAPRFSSDIYALGVMAIQALTGRQPSELPIDNETSQIIWHDLVSVSPGFRLILDRMVRYEFRSRFQSATDVLRALDKLSELPTNIVDVTPDMVLPESLLRVPLNFDPPNEGGWKGTLKSGLGMAIAISIAIAGGVIGIRQLGAFEAPELGTFDAMTRLRPALPPDPRLLLVNITEADLRNLNRGTPADETVAEALDILQEYNPRVVGLDLHREISQPPGAELLEEQFQADNLIAIMKLGDENAEGIPPPDSVPPERIGFNDLPIDPDGVVRRNLMFGSDGVDTFHSFATRIAFFYLREDGILPQQADEADPSRISLGKSQLSPLTPNTGGYQNEDANGYQILLSYRSPDNLAASVTLTEVLDRTFDPALVNDRIVLIGMTAPSAKDLFETPFTAARAEEHQMPGVVVHGQMVSQLLTAATDGTGVFWYLPEWAELGIILISAIAGGTLAWYVQKPVFLTIGSISVVIVLAGTTVLVFMNYGWIPMVAPVVAFLLSDIAVTAYRFHRLQRRQKHIETMLWSQ
jgi:CHASE2 domain-containing sensor protein